MTTGTVAINPFVALAPCRLSTAVTDTSTGWIYSNGESDNGIGATIRLASGTFSFDGFTPAAGDRILVAFTTGTQMLMNGIYMCVSTSLLIRAGDLQCSQQVNPGAYLSIWDGASNKGTSAVLTGAVPVKLGSSAAISFSISATAPSPAISNRENITADKTLIATDPQYQFLNPTAASQNVILPVAVTNMAFYIKNISTGVYTLQVQTSALANVGNAMAANIGSAFFYDGTAWQVI